MLKGTQIEPIFADLFEENLALEMSPPDLPRIMHMGRLDLTIKLRRFTIL
jgi:hypothetical protein